MGSNGKQREGQMLERAGQLPDRFLNSDFSLKCIQYRISEKSLNSDSLPAACLQLPADFGSLPEIPGSFPADCQRFPALCQRAQQAAGRLPAGKAQLMFDYKPTP